jgi:hypothetical protein
MQLPVGRPSLGLASCLLAAALPVAASDLPTSPDPIWTVRPAPAGGASTAPVTRLVSLGAAPPPARLVPAGDLPAGDLSAPAAVPQPAPDQQLALAPAPRPYLIRPSLGGAKPTGYVGGWGDYFISGSAGIPDKLRDGTVDGSINMGLSIGDPVRAIGVDVYWGISSIKTFNDGGSISASAGRVLVNRPNLLVAVAGGVIDGFTYSGEAGRTPRTGFGALTVAVPLRPNDPSFQQVLQLSAGGGGEGFAEVGSNFETSSGGFFAAAGLEVLPNLGLSVGVSSRSTNMNVSYIPFRTLPVFVNLAAVDVFDDTPWGTVGVLSVGWSDNFRRGYFNAQP